MLLWFADISAMEIDVRGQVSGWTTETRTNGAWRNRSGMRYLPEVTAAHTFGNGALLDVEMSLNGFLLYDSAAKDDADLKLYRLKLRVATDQTETRLGLQRINFGPASLLRSLQWFDQLDPHDPMQLTDGVYGLLFKYTALNNANVWLWGLYGNDDLKGYETLPSVDDTPEFGGRMQYPLFDGEFAATFHTRRVDASKYRLPEFREYRVALDGRWNLTIGAWFESVLQKQDSPLLPYQWTTMTTLGADYTFRIGNGLHLLAEHLMTALSDDPFGWDQDTHVSAMSLDYPIGLLDRAQAVGYYDWDEREYSQYVSWQRTYDNWMISLSAFHYPDARNDASAKNQQAFRAGYGGQVMVIFNH